MKKITNKNKRIWYLYVVRCRDNSLYTGITLDVQRRISEHNGNTSRTSKYLKGKGPLQLEFQKKIGVKSKALKLEYKIKKLPKSQKEMLIKGLLQIK
ncbi:MAG: GIY-YIG nuclease family protein [Candidatus Margulisbacteria bacterium]|nr:GIY-YIG nuclease family protein [Candidatus Margulisiibacteriota bacterium]